ncbi:MAG: hypothetical protein GX214_04640 [Clostridiales bacterium]|nr:hypothetical protein [Clostridiales bacterium]
MSMSRVEIKKEIKIKRRRLKFVLLLIFILQILGLLLVDNALREILALDGAKVLGYEIKDKYISIDFMGKTNYIARGKIDYTYEIIQNKYEKIIEKFNNFLKY